MKYFLIIFLFFSLSLKATTIHVGKKYAIKNGTWYTTSEEEKERQRQIMREWNKEKKLREENKNL